MDDEQKKILDKKRISFVKSALRSASLRWAPKNDALKAARKERGSYQCAKCEQLFKRHEIHLDHTDPVVGIEEGFTNWDDYINRLFIYPDGYQVLCILCHEIKTRLEDSMRAFHNAERKKAKKKEKKK
jgi:hypothetical protein